MKNIIIPKIPAPAPVLILLALLSNASWAVIPEPDNLIYGTVSVDEVPVTAADTNVSLVLEYEGKELSRYTMGETPSAGDQFVLAVPLDSVQNRVDGKLRTGDVLSIRYLMGTSRSGSTEVTVGERGTTIELDLALSSVDIIDGPDPNSTDTDGDGISDVVEIQSGLNPFDPSDAALDADGDGVSNLDEYLAGRNINGDDEPPLLVVPGDLEVPASGLLTQVSIGTATAYDALDGRLTAINNAPERFSPGAHFVTWSASDSAGNRAEAEQLVIVKPIANFQQDRVIAEGARVNLVVELNGPAAIYPVSIPYTVSGTAASGVDHTLADGVLTIDSGVRGSVEFQVIADNDNTEGVEVITATMGATNNVVPGARTVFNATISTSNVTPAALMTINGNVTGPVSKVFRSDGPFNVSVLVDDPNPNDTHTFDWSYTDPQLLDTDGDPTNNEFVINPTGLSPDFYTIAVEIRDSGFATIRKEFLIEIAGNPPLLSFLDSDGDGVSDEVEGYNDSNANGIPDYLDDQQAGNVIPSAPTYGEKYLVESEPGLIVGLGYVALESDKSGTLVAIEDIQRAFDLAPPEDGEELEDFPGGIFDFTISLLANPSDSAFIVLPQLASIPRSAVYRKYSETTMTWDDFVEDPKNAVYSAAGDDGFCPPPQDDAYTPGLTQGDWCVMLYIEDGGPNDADGLANQVIKDPGGVQGTYVAPSPKKGGGGGRIDLLLLALVIGIGLAYGTIKRKRLLKS